MVYVGKNVYKCTLYLCNVSKFKKCRKKGCNFYLILNMDYYDDNVGVVTEWNGKFLDF